MSMIRVSFVIWLIVAAGVAFGLYQVKYEVQHLEEELSSVRQDIREDRNALHVLEAEWSYLNRPERLQRLAETHLEMQPATPKQVAAVTQLPPRVTRSGPSEAQLASWPEMDGVPVPRAKPWSLEPRYAVADASRALPRTTQTAKAEASGTRTTESITTAAATETPAPTRRKPAVTTETAREPAPRPVSGAQVASADARTISVGHIKISLGGDR